MKNIKKKNVQTYETYAQKGNLVGERIWKP